MRAVAGFAPDCSRILRPLKLALKLDRFSSDCPARRAGGEGRNRTLDRQKGKFRWFLLAAREHFLANEWHCENRLKRGAGQKAISLEQQKAEERYQFEAADTFLQTPIQSI
jgi:hypothetical protein